MTVPDAAVEAGRDAVARRAGFDSFADVRPAEMQVIIHDAVTASLEAASETIACHQCDGRGAYWRKPLDGRPFAEYPCALCGGSGVLHILRTR